MKIPEFSIIKSVLYRIRTSSALASFLAMLIPTSVILSSIIMVSIFKSNYLGEIFGFILISFIIWKFCEEYDYWRKNDPNRLHSEEYLQKMKQLEMQATKSGGIVRDTILSSDGNILPSSDFDAPDKETLSHERDSTYE